MITSSKCHAGLLVVQFSNQQFMYSHKQNTKVASHSDSDVGDGDREVRVERDDSSPLSLDGDGDVDGEDVRSSRWMITSAAGGDGFLFEGARRSVASAVSLLRFLRGSPRISTLGSPLRPSFLRALGSPLGLLVW